MRLSRSFFYTLRENTKDEESVSGNLLTRAGMIKRTSSGVYMYLPLGYKVLKNIEKIIREEMEDGSCAELMMPTLINEELFSSSLTIRTISPSWYLLCLLFSSSFFFTYTVSPVATFSKNLSERWILIPFPIST